MDYLSLWKVFEELITELKKKGITVSDQTMKKLRGARATINIYTADPTYQQTAADLMTQLTDLEMELMTLGEQQVGEEFTKEWLEKITAARNAEPKDSVVDKGFPKGVPRSDYWIRLTIGDTIPSDELREMAAKHNLSIKEESTDQVVVHGEQKIVKLLVKEMTEKQRERKDRD
ncbi:MAG: DUF2096 family protein [Candidatus Thorarchaeota archaeon]|jgi:hypothetical protein